ncbi:hypothetical protein L484_009716 [Morus notabilis]|uniref:Uncharacterized protein n=1 Tax=Morus notabilis TaxID=981085 RepID=W9SGF6_9ROSA|nr:hypothetical protein L484_009716 [Morus notabilis]
MVGGAIEQLIDILLGKVDKAIWKSALRTSDICLRSGRMTRTHVDKAIGGVLGAQMQNLEVLQVVFMIKEDLKLDILSFVLTGSALHHRRDCGFPRGGVADVEGGCGEAFSVGIDDKLRVGLVPLIILSS